MIRITRLKRLENVWKYSSLGVKIFKNKEVFQQNGSLRLISLYLLLVNNSLIICPQLDFSMNYVLNVITDID